jgi:membrane peptidoglycan carboxypeptidase
VSSNDFDGPNRPAGGRGANEYLGGGRGAGAGGSGARETGRHSAGRNGDGSRGGYARGNGKPGNGKAGKYPEPEGWGDDGFWRDSGIDSDYETGLNGAVRTDGNGPRGDGGYSYWADDKGWQNSPGSGAGSRGADRDATPGDATRADYGAGAGAGFGAAASYGPPGGGQGYYGGADPTAAYGNGPGSGYGPPGPPGAPGPGGPGGPGRRGPGRGGRGAGPGGPGGRGRAKMKGRWWRHWTWKKAAAVVGSAFVLFFLLLIGAYEYEYHSTQLPTQELVADTYQNSTVYYSDGKTPIGTFAIFDRQILNWNQIPAVMDDAVMAAEDRSFMTEGGISPTGILRAAWDDLTGSGGSLSGGSTITQEFVRQYYAGIGTQQTLGRKIKEAFVAIKISKEKSKQWILTNFMNTIDLGDNAYGVAAASQTYFGVPVSKLTVAQAAVIAAIIQQPSNYWQPQYRPELINRWHYVLDGMVKMGKLSPAAANGEKFPKMLTDSGTQQQGTSSSNDPWAPYIMNVVANELEGVEKLSLAQLETGGYKIVTTISRPMEVQLYSAVDQNETLMKQDGGALPPYALVGAELQNPATGAIVAMYPGRGQNMSKSQCLKYHCDDNTAVYAREQVGSSFKPFVLATAVSEGMNVKTSILNGFSPLWVPQDQPPYQMMLSARSAAKAEPGAYEIPNDGNVVFGPMNVQNALAQSSNTAFADLTHRVGTPQIVQVAGEMGVNLEPYKDGGSGLATYEHEVGMALGIAPLTVNEQDSMLATIDDNGTHHSAHVVDWYQAPGGPVQHGIVSTQVVLSPALDSQVQYAMEATTVDGTGTAAAMSDGRPIIGKTGTTNSALSAFFIGAIPQYALAVGIFTESQAPTTTETLNGLGGNVGGGFGGYWPARIWNTFAQNVFLKLPAEPFQSPVFTGAKWNQVGNLPKKKPPKKKPHNQNCTQGHFIFNCPTQPPGHGHGHGPTQSPTPTATQTFPTGPPTPTQTQTPPATSTATSTATPSNSATATQTPPPGFGGAATVGGAQAGLALGGILSVLPGSLLWARVSRRRKRRRPGSPG